MTLQDAICIALRARGFIEVKPAGKYRKFDANGAERPIVLRHRFVLVGPQGGVRVTNGAISNSLSLTGSAIVTKLIAEGQPARAAEIEI